MIGVKSQFVFLIIIFSFLTLDFFAQNGGQKSGTIKVRKHSVTTSGGVGVDSANNDSASASSPNTNLLNSATLLIDYKYYLVDTITSIEPGNLPSLEKCISCWYKDSMIFKNRVVGVRFPTVLLGGYLMRRIEDSLKVVSLGMIEKNLTIDTFEIGFLIDNKGKLFDFIYPISRTTNNAFLVRVLSNELNQINANKAKANQIVFTKAGQIFLEPEKRRHSAKPKKNQKREKFETNIYCRAKITVKNSQFNNVRQDYLAIDRPINCDALLQVDIKYKNEVVNSKNMVFPILNAHFK